MQQFLAFVDEIGRTNEGKYIYRFDFTENTDVVWGDYFNIAPAVIVPDLQPDVNCLSSYIKAIFPRELEIAKKNSCFSMQDCIDGIISLCFSELDDEPFEVDGEPINLEFGIDKNTVVNKFINNNIDITEDESMITGDDSPIENLINTDILNNNDEDDDF